MITQAELKGWREELLALRRRLDGQIAHLRAEVMHTDFEEDDGGETNRSVHHDDLSKERATEEVLVRIVENESILRREVEAALERMREGHFGICESCEKPIPKKRLDLLPFARHCVRCADASQTNDEPKH